MKIEEAKLANEQGSTIEHESKLKLAGLNSEALRNANANSVWVICAIPENQLDKIKIRGACNISFTSYSNQVFKGVLKDLGDVLDNVTLKALVQKISGEQFRAILMMLIVAIIGLMPAATSKGIGSDVQRPLSTVIIGGLTSTLIFTPIIIPALFYWVSKKKFKKI